MSVKVIICPPAFAYGYKPEVQMDALARFSDSVTADVLKQYLGRSVHVSSFKANVAGTPENKEHWSAIRARERRNYAIDK